MEVAGLAIGAASLAGLFTSVLDAVDRVKDYRSFTIDSKISDAQLNGYRAQLVHWGREVGLVGGQLSDGHSQTLDPSIFTAAQQLLEVANELLAPGHLSHDDGTIPNQPKTIHQSSSRSSISAKSRWRKLGWALGGKGEQTKKIESFGRVVQQLCSLVPTRSADDIELSQRTDAGFAASEASDLNLKELFAQVRQMNEQVIAERVADMKHKLAIWLMGTTAPSEIYHDSLQKRLPGTCEWIFNQPQFHNWLLKDTSKSVPPLLWIHGHAGFGKTVLCAQIVHHLVSRNDRTVAYFFFSSDFASMGDPYIAIRSWVLQLAVNNDTAFELACTKWNESADQVLPSRQAIIHLLQQILAQIPQCALIVDGLDQCTTAAKKEQDSIGRFLLDIREAMAETTRVLVVSRDEPEIRHALESSRDETVGYFKIYPDHVRSDTNILSQNIINKKLPNKSEDVKKDLSAQLSSRCDGQFIWLMMQQTSLRKGHNLKALKRAIDETPSGLHQLYQRNWNSILAQQEDDRQRALALLRWAAFSSRPLTICEMAEAVLLDKSAKQFPVDDLPDSIDDDFIDTEILGLCGPLLEVRCQSKDQPPERRTVHVAHFSIREYLIYQLPTGYENLNQSSQSSRSSNEQVHYSLLSHLCLVYIMCPNTWDNIQITGFRKAFRDYAASSWHLSRASSTEHKSMTSSTEHEAESDFFDLALGFMTETHPCWRLWREWFDEQDTDKAAREEAKAATEPSEPLYYSLRLHLDKISLQLALSQQFSIGHRQGGRSTLHLACLQGNSMVVTALLGNRSSSQINALGVYGWTPLMAASYNGQLETVRLLLDNGADLAVADNDGWTPLIVASYNGQLETVRLLLDKRADLAVADNDGWTPLMAASYNGQLKTVRLLLDRGADLAVADNNGWTPLMAASYNGQLETVRLLLNRGADLAVANNDGSTPLIAASYNGQLDTVRLLLNRGADLAVADNDGSTPLIAAAQNGQLKTVRLLLDNGADPAVANNNGLTPLILASYNGQLETVRLLLDKRADLAVADNDGWMPLMAASYNGQLKTARLLLDRGADLAVADNNGWTPLIVAAENGQLKTVRLLLDRGADLAVADNSSWTPLMAASYNGQLDTVRLLLDRGADLAIANNGGWTPLMIAAENGQLETVRLLLDRGADLAVANNSGSTPLIIAASRDHGAVVHMLLDRPQEINIVDDCGRTALFHASRYGFNNIVTVLLSNGQINPMRPDHFGSTALYTAAINGHCDTVRLLLDYIHLNLTSQDNWWTLRSGSSAVSLMLREYSQQNGTPLALEDLFTDSNWSSSDENSRWCDRCTRMIPSTVMYYKCSQCSGGDFGLCQECIKSGTKCLDDSHFMTLSRPDGIVRG